MPRQPQHPPVSLANVQPLVGEHFFPAVTQYIDQADKSLSICIFTARYYRNQSRNPVNSFFDALRRAARRGVNVRFLLNQNFGDQRALQNNLFIIQHFKNKNFQTAFAGKSTRIHSKLILIDDKITIVGSHNYSARAHRTNFETSVAVQSDAFAQYFAAYYERLWAARVLVKGRIT